MRERIQHWQVIAFGLICFDIIAISFSYFLGLWLRFDFSFGSIPQEYLLRYARFLPIYLVICIVFFWFMRMYRAMWRFTGFRELLRYALASLIASGVHILLITLIFGRMPISYYLVGTVIQLILVVGVRFTYRFYIEVCKKQGPDIEIPESRVMVIGAGDAGRTVIKDLLRSSKVKIHPVCVIDDNPNKWGRFIEGVPIVGGREEIPRRAEEYSVDQIYFCIPGITAQEKKKILDICKETGCELKSLPGIYQLANDEVLISDLKPVQIEDLLGRDPITVDLEEIFEQLTGKTILVTGGGGSIGSELCRQIAAHQPKRLIIFDIYENTTYEIERELREQYPKLRLDVLIGSVRDSRRVNQIFETYRPDIVYHAAAHKHVPMMEFSPNEAIKNNVIGTYKTAYAALKYGTKRFVLISTDKAVNPTNIMGASKRLCEMVIQSIDTVSKVGRPELLPFLHAHQENGELDALYEGEMEAMDPDDLKIESTKDRKGTGTQFVAVRFGNVLGSNGSVIPIFQKQIEEGGPLTVTDPEITRYFMTIPEAVSLVLQAGTYAWGGEIFVLDMGEPIKIDTLARNLIQLSGYKPDEDIEIVYTGLRPGEKLYEEKLMAEEGLRQTQNKLIYIGKPIPFEVTDFLKQLEELAKASYENSDHIVEMVEEIVTTYHPEQGTVKDESEV
ncbi:MAG: polysaccharide biosynthesis protein [Clostridiales bacterium]|nr:polysaccharide biosynthesis protein [Clostridiales bacterium]